MYDELCQVMKEVFLKENKMTCSFYDTKKQIAAFGLPKEKTDCWLYGCIIYWRCITNVTPCEVGGLSRWISDHNYYKAPRKQFHHFPLSLRLKVILYPPEIRFDFHERTILSIGIKSNWVKNSWVIT